MTTIDHQFVFSNPSLDGLFDNYGSGHRYQYLKDYLKEIGTKTWVIEEDYIDKDYMIDYQKYYSRSFQKHERFTKRIHFFSNSFSQEKFLLWLQNSEIKNLKQSYLGFTIIRPIYSAIDELLIGRTLLKCYPRKEGDYIRNFSSEEYCVYLFGIPLTIQTMPFQEQDHRVSACATIALWSSLHVLWKRFGLKYYSPAEITEKAGSFPGLSRKFPSSGLSLDQLIGFIRSMELDVEAIFATNNELITTAIAAYLNAEIPIIATLELKNGNSTDYHAVVISGYKYKQNNPNIPLCLYVHDDQIGPYSKVEPVNNMFLKWKNDWISKYNMTEVKIEMLLVPVYSKIRLTFPRIYAVFKKIQEEIEESGLGEIVKLELKLYSVNKYKESLLNKSINNKTKILRTVFPRFLWVVRAFKAGHPDDVIWDMTFDGVAAYPRDLEKIDYLE